MSKKCPYNILYRGDLLGYRVVQLWGGWLGGEFTKGYIEKVFFFNFFFSKTICLGNDSIKI